jgi:hypothetical protein
LLLWPTLNSRAARQHLLLWSTPNSRAARQHLLLWSTLNFARRIWFWSTKLTTPSPILHKYRIEVIGFIFSKMSISAVGRTYPSIQWEPVAIFPGVMRPRCEANHSLPSNTEVTNAWICVSAVPMSLHGVYRDMCVQLWLIITGNGTWWKCVFRYSLLLFLKHFSVYWILK